MTKTAANVRLVTGTSPPRKLGQHGADLWRRIMSEYDLSDAGGRELLLLGCQMLDRAEDLREVIERESEFIKMRNVCARMLRMLGLHQEPLHSRPGRPGSGLGVTRMDTLRCEHELRREEDAL
jgi:hypothetical protein